MLVAESEAFSLRVDAQPETTPQAQPGLQQAVASNAVRSKDVERISILKPLGYFSQSSHSCLTATI